MYITDNLEKLAIVERLVKDGAIDFSEAMKLLEKEVEYWFNPVQPAPVYPQYPPWGYHHVTCINQPETISSN